MTHAADAHEIMSDGKTVWVNGEGVCLGRFSRFGIEIHAGMIGQLHGITYLNCTHGRPTADNWDTFVEDMRRYHGIKIDNEHKPDFVREP